MRTYPQCFVIFENALCNRRPGIGARCLAPPLAEPCAKVRVEDQSSQRDHQGWRVLGRYQQSFQTIVKDTSISFNRGCYHRFAGSHCLPRSAADLARHEAQLKGVALRVEGAARPLTGDAAALEQVVYNLVRNAVQASPEGAAVTLTVSARQVVVEDQGTGLTPEVMEHLFEPFFTTKALGEGTGLGLAVAHGIVRDHGGTLVAEARPGGGARFVVRLG